MRLLEWAAIQWDRLVRKKIGAHKHQGMTIGGHRENVLSQGNIEEHKPRRTQTANTYILYFQPQNSETINFWHLSHPVCGILL
jgi:hypothetical protein